MDFGKWDKSNENNINFLSLCEEFYRVLKKSGTVIIFWDLWKIQDLSNFLKKSNFSQLRFIEWIKTNPVPINSKVNYLTNAREVAILGIKGNKPTFNSKYDNGLYFYPIEHSTDRIHPTQKSLKLIKDLINKHSKPNDIILDVFLGSGTTAVAAKQLDRRCLGCEIDSCYFNSFLERYKKA